MPTGKKLSKKGGSLASDAVINAVPKGAFPKLDAMFDNKFGGASFCKMCGKKAHGGKKCLGGGKGVLVNYNGLLTTPNNLPVSASPSVSVKVGGIKPSAQLRHISHFSDSSAYNLRNRMVGGQDVKPLVLGLNYDAAVKSAANPSGPSVQDHLSANNVLGEIPVSILPVPMTKSTAFGTVTDGTGTNFKYGGGIVKKIIVAAAIKHAAKKSVKAIKKMKSSSSSATEKKTNPKKTQKTQKKK